MGHGHICAVKHCLNKRAKTKSTFFCFPKEPQRARVWAMAAGREDLLNKIDSLCISHRICEIHFENSSFTNEINNRLLPSATPTIFPSLERTSSDHTYSVVGPRPQSLSVQADDSMEKTKPSSKVVLLENIIVTPGKIESTANSLRSPSPTSENSQPTHIVEDFSSTRLSQSSPALLSDTPSQIELENNVRFLRNKNLQLEKQLKECESLLQKTKDQFMQDITLDDYMTLTYKFCGSNMELAYFINVQVSQMEEV